MKAKWEDTPADKLEFHVSAFRLSAQSGDAHCPPGEVWTLGGIGAGGSDMRERAAGPPSPSLTGLSPVGHAVEPLSDKGFSMSLVRKPYISSSPFAPLRLVIAVVGLACFSMSLHAVDVDFRPVAPGVYAHIGEKGGRTFENEGLNANLGLVVTPVGSLLIDSGATYSSARQIDEAIRRVTGQAVKWVINTGGQDHRWLGNGYFNEQGAQLIAHAGAAADMRSRGGEQVLSLKATLKERADGTVPTLPERWIEGSEARLELGGVVFELKHRGGAHTPGDMMVWLPDRGVLFSGDVVYVDRMLGVIPVSNTRRWLENFALIEQLDPKIIVPGHGSVTDLATARADTKAYLVALRTHLKKAVDDGTDIGTAVRGFDVQPFLRLLNAAELHPGNASRTFLELEWE